ncbi:cellular morphogenesis regulator dopa [Lentithecium fluviatile CBS 122367]|uniref:Cellular morphogenesis regulator dopa n=1 Tax=Lentithecium fluviatile CBS 122367 TaxID=1168545 RepID=A0A6G1ILR8_9PLEO|nr:cellular morphogenesis regulator dopa [Lentithecium fluviatile CBS 122367]
MSHDLSANLQIFSPTGSGRSSPSPRVTRNNAEDALQKKDKSFRRYAAGVERALAVWDTTQQEWADYISFLGRLLKALQSHPPETPVIPHSEAVALRLAQCLNPTLPSGVHQKALEVYTYIFSTIGKEALARDLNLYFPGLASVLSFASLSVRPLFLSLFEGHVLKLDATALRPALKAVVLSLLPGLEDETSEDFERMVSALDKLRDAVRSSVDEITDVKSDGGSSHFWQCFFLAAITNASRRQGALAYLVRRLPKFGSPQRRGSVASMATTATSETLPAEAEAAISPEPGLLIRCFESGLSDPQLLIQRGFLDLLVSHLPLDSPVLQHRLSKDDLERLVAAAASVVSRRDMSLNRRLWAWFLGPEPPAGTDGNESLSSPTDAHNAAADPSAYHAAYFQHYGLHALTQSVLKTINRPSKIPSERAKPFRLCLSLMDRWEVGGLIVPEVFLPALQSIQSYSETATKEQVDEVMRSANTFFDGVDSGLIWGKLTQLVTTSLDSTVSRQVALRQMKLAKFVLARFNLKEEEMLLHHMPLMVLATLATLNQVFEKTVNKSSLDAEVFDLAFEIVDSLVQIVPGRAIADEQARNEDLNPGTTITRGAIVQKIHSFYEEAQGSLDVTDAPFAANVLGEYMLRESALIFAASMGDKASGISPEMPSRILSNTIFKVGHLTALDDIDPFAIFHQVLSTASGRPTPQPPFTHYSALTTVLCALQTASLHEPYLSASQVSEIIHPLVASLWQYLSPLMPKYHVEVVRCILQLHTISPSNRIVEAAIASIVARKRSPAHTVSDEADAGRRFAILWTHTMYELSLQSENRGSVSRRSSGMGAPTSHSQAGSAHSVLERPLLLLLDSLADEGTEMATFTRSWLQDLPSLSKVFEVLVIHLQSLQCLSSHNSLTPGKLLVSSKAQPQADDTKDCLYYLKHVNNILRQPSRYTWVTLAEEAAPQTLESPSKVSLQEWLVKTCMSTLSVSLGEAELTPASHLHELYRVSVDIISQIYQSPSAPALRSLELEVPLMARLRTACPSLQSMLLAATLSTLKLRVIQPPEEQNAEQKVPNQPTHRSRLSITTIRNSEDAGPAPVSPPPQLVDTLKYGFSSSSSRLVLDDWVHFLVEVLPLFADTIFQNLLPLVECFCKQITMTFEQLKAIFVSTTVAADISPETTLISLINGLEQILARAHDRLMLQETKSAVNKSPEQPQGFFGNMVSGVFSSDTNQTRTPTANSRLTVLLCFQDTVRICFAVWSWGGYGSNDGRQDATSASSFGYTSLRMRNRARRILEHLFAAEALECLETLAVLWAKSSKDDTQAISILGLLNVLNGSKPKHTIPAIFNAVYSRTNPNALDPNRMSTLTSDLADTDLVAFLVDYTKSLEDDAMDEIWLDCTLFLRDVLTNPLPHRQILPSLLEFTAVIGQKVDNTNFGEQRKMRKELADIFQRILTAIFTTRSMGFLQDPSQVMAAEKISASTNSGLGHKRANDVVFILNSIVPHLPIILVENERVANVVTSISTSVIGPTFRAKAFPDNVTKGILDLLQSVAKVAQANKFWKKDLYDAFNDPKFFSSPLPLLRESWLPILAQWTHSDKDRLLELLSRLSAPTTAGIMFGVGAASARQEADRKTQLTLRRIALLILGSPEDAFTPSIPSIMEKMVELLTATPASSPSSITRAEVFILLRALILKTSSIHLASLWPTINSELTSSLSSLLPDADNKDHYNNAGIVQACKLLDELVVLAPDDFQLIEWLYISDTIDAVYKPTHTTYLTSLTDEISEVLQHAHAHASSLTDVTTSRSRPRQTSLSYPHANTSTPSGSTSTVDEPKRSLFLDPLIAALEKEEGAEVTIMARRELVDRVVRPFLGSLAMGVFEATYGGGEVDWEGMWGSVVADARGME